MTHPFHPIKEFCHQAFELTPLQKLYELLLFFSNQKSDLHPCKSPFSPREIAAKRRFFAGAQIPRYWILRYYYITIFAIRQSNLRKFLTKNLTKIVPIFQSIFFHYFFEPVRVIKN